MKFMVEGLESDVYWYGVVMNSFKELEPAYVEHYKIGYGEEDMEHRSFVSAQLNEIAKGLEASGQDFIWFVREVNVGKEEELLPKAFEEWVKGKGLIIRGWAPQV
ncbi:hypothetical protein V6N13_090800 [Hibiscus sabdariffa]